MLSISKQRQVPFFYSIVNPIIHFLILRFGLGAGGDQDFLRILRVRGRKSGRMYETPVRIAIMNRQRYIIAMLGETQWVRNLRSTNSAQLLAGKTIEQIRVEEITGEKKAAFLAWYSKHPQYEQRARYGLKANTKHLTPVEIERLSRLYPVFIVEKE
jgi:deazaflavin-dependent oxidoreductase (nitroreductase family)